MMKRSRYKKYSIFDSYKTKYPWSVVWESIMCYWKKFKSRSYQNYLKDVEKFKIDASLENIISLKAQVSLLAHQQSYKPDMNSGGNFNAQIGVLEESKESQNVKPSQSRVAPYVQEELDEDESDLK